MENRTVGIIATIATALLCGCASFFTCIFGILIATETPFDTTVNGVDSVQTFPPTIGFVLLCLTLIFLLVPVGVGFFTLRRKPGERADEKPAPISNEPPIPPAT